MSSSNPNLLIHAERAFPHAVDPKFLSCCPSMDLIATVSHDGKLDVYRFNGQRAFGLQRRTGGAHVISLSWKYNGQSLAIGWSDGLIEAVSAETGNAVQQLRQLVGKAEGHDEGEGGVSCIGWGMNFLDVDAVQQKLGMTTDGDKGTARSSSRNPLGIAPEDISLDEFLERMPDREKLKIPSSLPDQLSHIDILHEFPRLSILPLLPPAMYKSGHHPSAELFAVQTSLDAALHTNDEDLRNELTSLMLCQEDGSIRLIVYDSLSIGTLGMLGIELNAQRVRHLQHTFHPFSRTHMFLTEYLVGASDRRLALMPLTLKFLGQAGTHLQIIEFKTAELQYLVQYVVEAILAIKYHWKHAQELPSRFINMINEELQEKDNVTLMQSLYHLTCTGHCPAVLKEWLVDTLAERGHKRWDHSINHGYTKVLEVTHENLLPALDRCDIILARLRGLFEYHESNPAFDIPGSLFTPILEIIRCLRLLAHNMLFFGGREHRAFQQFSKWLRHEIDVQATDPTSTTAEETLEKDIGVDIRLLLDYLKGPFEASKLGNITAECDSLVIEHDAYDRLKKVLKSSAGSSVKEEDTKLLCLSGYMNAWIDHDRILVEQITSWQHQSCVIHAGLTLHDGATRTHDIRMVYEKQTDDMSTYIAILPTSPEDELHLYRSTRARTIDAMQESSQSLHNARLRVEGSKILDVKFIDDEYLMLLLASNDHACLIQLPYRLQSAEKIRSKSSTNEISTLKYRTSIPSTIQASTPINYTNQTNHIPKSQTTSPTNKPPPLPQLQNIDLNSTTIKPYIKHVFPPTQLFKPLKIEVNGRKDRRFVVVLGEDCRSFKVFDLDYLDRDGDGGGEFGSEDGDFEDEDEDDDGDANSEVGFGVDGDGDVDVP